MRPFAALGLVALITTACATTTPPAGGGGVIAGPEWKLEDLLGGGIIDRSNVTLTLGPGGQASGSGGCNRFFGSWAVKGSALTLGKMGSTMMACDPALMNQEGKFLRSLETATSYNFTPDGALVITTAQGPLKFRKD